MLRAHPGGITTHIVNHEKKYALRDGPDNKPRGFATETGKVEIYSEALAAARVFAGTAVY
ncbi:hypothetical protein LNO81_16815 [Klebsiella variicola subsp. variicola]|nr:hypothetical protein [Klebsiella variicola subsp. variicola]